MSEATERKVRVIADVIGDIFDDLEQIRMRLDWLEKKSPKFPPSLGLGFCPAMFDPSNSALTHYCSLRVGHSGLHVARRSDGTPSYFWETK